MAKILVSDLILEVQRELSMVEGLSTDQYGTPRTLQHIQDAYLELIDDFGDRVLEAYHDTTLDGITGVITTNLVSTLTNHEINRFDDIKKVWVAGHSMPLPILPPSTNVRLLTGTTPRYIEVADITKRPFMCYPITSTGNLVVLSKAYPVLPLAEDSYVYIDRLLIVYKAAYLYAEDDATAPGQIAKFARLVDKRTMQLTKSNNNQSVLLDRRSGSIPNTWDYRD